MMEDFDFVWRARDLALASGYRIDILPAAAQCSPRRWQRQGVVVNSVRNWFFVAAYVLGGASPDTIFKWYYGRSP